GQGAVVTGAGSSPSDYGRANASRRILRNVGRAGNRRLLRVIDRDAEGAGVGAAVAVVSGASDDRRAVSKGGAAGRCAKHGYASAIIRSARGDVGDHRRTLAEIVGRDDVGRTGGNDRRLAIGDSDGEGAGIGIATAVSRGASDG